MTRLGSAIATVSLLTALQASPAAASVIMTTNSNTEVLEGQSLTLTYTITNTDGADAIGRGTGFSGIVSLSGDPTDVPTLSAAGFPFPASCITVAANGGTCTFSITLDTGPADSDNDNDFGLSRIDPLIDFTEGSNPEFAVDDPTVIMVDDAPVSTPVPEPASLAIFGAGVAMLGVMRRKVKAS